jgi:hypothetical protein
MREACVNYSRPLLPSFLLLLNYERRSDAECTGHEQGTYSKMDRDLRSHDDRTLTW